MLDAFSRQEFFLLMLYASCVFKRAVGLAVGMTVFKCRRRRFAERDCRVDRFDYHYVKLFAHFLSGFPIFFVFINCSFQHPDRQPGKG